MVALFFLGSVILGEFQITLHFDFQYDSQNPVGLEPQLAASYVLDIILLNQSQ